MLGEMPGELFIRGLPVAGSLIGSTAIRLADVASGWLLTYLVHSTLILGVVWLVASRRGVRDATRDILWKAGLVGGIVTASVQSVTTHEPLGGQWKLDGRTAAGTERALRVAAVREEGLDARKRVIVTAPKPARWTTALVTIWMLGGGAALLWLTVAQARAARLLGDRESLENTPIGSRLRALLRRSGIDRTVELTCSDGIASPVALASDEVCLPRRALLELETIEQDSMLAHEVAHVVRRDPQWLILARAIEAVLFVQPLNRLARRRMQDVAEFLCDDWAVQRTKQPVMLAKCLAAVAEWIGRAPRMQPTSAMVEAGGSPLVRRVRRILNGGDPGRSRSSRGALAATVCALLVLAVAAPRVSIAREVMADRTVTFVQTIVGREMSPAGRAAAEVVMRRMMRDTVIVVRRGPLPPGVVHVLPRPETIESIAGARVGVGSGSVAAGGFVRRVPVGQAGIIVRRVAQPALDRPLPDSGAAK